MTYDPKKNSSVEACNLEMLAYYNSIADIVIEKTKALEYLGIKDFSYIKIFPDNSSFRLSNTPSLITQDTINFKSIVIFCQKSHLIRSDTSNFQYVMWPKTPARQPGQSSLFQKKFDLFLSCNLWNGLSLIKQENGIIKMYSFCGTKNEYGTGKYLYGIRNLLHKFIFYFDSLGLDPTEDRNTGLGLFENVEIYYEKTQQSLGEENVKKFLDSIILKGFNIRMGQTKINISAREIECLKYLSSGKLHKEIGHELNISPKTVENHLANIKQKTDLYNKTALIDFYHKNFACYSQDA